MCAQTQRLDAGSNTNSGTLRLTFTKKMREKAKFKYGINIPVYWYIVKYNVI